MYVSQVLFSVLWGFVLLGSPMWLQSIYVMTSILSKDVKRRTPRNNFLKSAALIVPMFLLPSSMVFSIYSIWTCVPPKELFPTPSTVESIPVNAETNSITTAEAPTAFTWIYYYFCCFLPAVLALLSYRIVRYLYKAAKKGR